MSLSTPTAIAPIPSTAWLFPPALNQTFVSNFTANLPPVDERLVSWLYWENGTRTRSPPSFYGEYGTRPDIILDSIQQMTYNERIGVQPYMSTNITFGRSDLQRNVIHAQDTIQMDWVGEEEKTVTLACQHCEVYHDEPDVFDACDKFGPKYIKNINLYHRYLIANNTDRYNTLDVKTIPATSAPIKLKRNAPVIVLPNPQEWGLSLRGAAACIFTLDFDPARLSTQFSVPFALNLDARRVGYNKSRPVYESWTFNSTHPDGVCVQDCWEGYQLPRMDLPKTEKKHPKLAIIGAVVGGIVVLVVGLSFAEKYRKKEKRKAEEAVRNEATVLPMHSRRTSVEHGPVSDYGGRRPVDEGISTVDDVPPPTYLEATKARQ